MPPKKKSSLALKQDASTQNISPPSQAYRNGDSLVFQEEDEFRENEQSAPTVQDLTASSSSASSLEKDLERLEQRQRRFRRPFPMPRQQSKKRRRWRPMWTTIFLIASLAYWSLVICTDDQRNDDAFCTGLSALDRGRSALVAKVDQLGQPYLEQAQHHLQPYWEPLQPHYQALRSHTDPAAARAQQFYDDTVYPLALEYYQQARARAGPLQQDLLVAYHQHGKPIVQRYAKFYGSLWRLNVAPALARLQQRAGVEAERALLYVQHRFDTFQAEHFPALHAWTTDTLYPALRALGRFIHQALRTAHRIFVFHIYPAGKKACLVTSQTVSGNVLPQLRRWHSLYITPQMDRVVERVWQHRAEQLSHAHEKEVMDHMGQVQEAAESAAAVEVDTEPDQGTWEDRLQSVEDVPKSAIVVETTQAAAAEPAPEVVSISSEAVPTQVESTPSPTPEVIEVEEKQSEQAKLAAQRLAVTNKHSELEKELEAVAKAELALLQERLASASERASRDVAFRFESKLQELRSDSERNTKRLQRWAEKRKLHESGPDDVDSVVNKAQSKVIQRAGDLVDELDAYGQERTRQAERAVDEAIGSIRKFLNEPRNELARQYAWLKDVTYLDWQRYHQLTKEEDRYAREFRDLATDQVAQSQLSDYEDAIDQIADEFSEVTEDIRRSVKARAGAGPVLAQATESLNAPADAVSSTLAAAVASSSGSPTNVPESAAALWEQATSSAASLAEDIDLAELTSLSDVESGATSESSGAVPTKSLSEVEVDHQVRETPTSSPTPSPAPIEHLEAFEHNDVPDTADEAADAQEEDTRDPSAPSPPAEQVAVTAGDYLFAEVTPTLNEESESEGVRGTIPELFESPTEDSEVETASLASPSATPPATASDEADSTETIYNNVHDAYSGRPVHEEL